MPFGKAPFMRDALDVLIDRRIGRQNIDTLLKRAPGLEGGYIPDFNTPAPPPRQPSALRQGIAGAFSDTGQEAFGSGIQAGLQQRGFLPALAAAFGTTLGAGAKLRRAEAAGTEAKALKDREMLLRERGVGAQERQAAAAETRAARGPGTGHVAQDLESQYNFLADTLGWSDEEIDSYFKTRGLTGSGGRAGGGGGRGLTDLDKVAQGLVSTGRAPDLNTAYVMARTLTQQPQQVGSITRTIGDPNNLWNTTTVRVSVARRINPVTGQFELMDDQGNLVTAQDMTTFQANPQGYAGGTGGPAVAPPQAPAQAPVAGAPIAPGAPTTPAAPAAPAPMQAVPSHAPTGAAPPAPVAPAPAPAVGAAPPPMSDFTPGVQGATEEQIASLLAQADPNQDREVIQAYAAGRGPLGNSTAIKARAAAILGGAQ